MNDKKLDKLVSAVTTLQTAATCYVLHRAFWQKAWQALPCAVLLSPIDPILLAAR